MTVRPALSYPWSRRCAEIETEKDTLRIQLVTFEPGRQCDHAFEVWEIAMPPEIARSAKESFYKAAFATIGRVFGFEAVRSHFIDARREVLGFTVAQPLGAVFSKGSSFEVKFAVPAPGTVLTSFIW